MIFSGSILIVRVILKMISICDIFRQYSDSSSDSEDDLDTWRQQRQKFKQTVATRGISAKPLPNKPIPVRYELDFVALLSEHLILATTQQTHTCQVLACFYGIAF